MGMGKDNDGLGDACDSKPGFVVIRLKMGGWCLILGDGRVESTRPSPSRPKHTSAFKRQFGGMNVHLPPMHSSDLSQQSAAVVQFSYSAEQLPSGAPHAN